MSSTEEKNDAFLALPPAIILQFERICNEVEDRLRQCANIDLRLFLKQVLPEYRGHLFRELIELRKSYPVEGNHAGLAASLKVEFPEYLPVIHEVFGKEESARVIGRYQLIHRIGTGGMGEVWFASQQESVHRNVAIKLIKCGLDSNLFLQRFAQERQLLALMDHPNIAHVYDGGVTDTQQPYMVMELINGLSLSRFCDENRMTIQERLRLFVTVCQAVQHAHQKGIIHRDLKPANILVMKVDGVAVPKIIDFGVAKAIGDNLAHKTLDTQQGLLIGTLEYMSPEQAEWSSDIDTRADIYSLGVILYELITSLRPFDFKKPHPPALDEMIRMIKEELPQSMYSRLSTCQSLSDIALLRKTDASQLKTSVKEELEWIVRKCLEKDRKERYESISGLSRDIERYLNDEPVEARPVTASYRFRKFIRRHRVPVITAGFVLLTLIGGIIGTTFGMYQANVARIAEQKAKDKAEEHLAYSRKTNEIIVSLFNNLDPEKNFRSVSEWMEALKENLKQATSSITSLPTSDELEQARMRNLLAVSLAHLGEHKLSLELAQTSFEISKRHFQPDHPQLLEIMHNLGLCYKMAGMLDKATPVLNEVLIKRMISLDQDHPQTLNSMSSMASIYLESKQYDLALNLFTEVLTKRRMRLGATHRDTMISMQNLASLYWEMQQLDRSIPLFEELFTNMQSAPGPDHTDTLLVQKNLAVNYITASRPGDAVPLLRDVLKRQQSKLNFDHPAILRTLHDLAGAHHSMNRFDLSIPLFEEALRIRTANHGRSHPETLESMTILAVNYRQSGKPSKAVELLEECYRLTPGGFTERFPVGGQLLYAYQRAGKHTEASSLFESLVTDYRKSPPRLVVDQVKSLTKFGQFQLDYHKYVEAESFLRECLIVCHESQPDHWTTFYCESMLGGALLGQKKYPESEKHLVNGVKGMRQRENDITIHALPFLEEAYDRLIRYCAETNKPIDRLKWQLEKKTLNIPEMRK